MTSGTITLKPTGDTLKIGSGNVTVVGDAPQWGDGSDSTYSVGDTGNGNRSDAGAPIEVLSLPAGATYTAVRAQIKCSSTTSGAAQLALASGSSHLDFVTYFTSDLADPSDNGTSLPADGATYVVDLIQSTHEVDADVLSTLAAGAWVWASTSSFDTLTVYDFTVFVDYDDGSVDLPCDTDVAMDLSSAEFSNPSGDQFGQYVDGIITAGLDGHYPQFAFPGVTLDPVKPYRVRVTFDPTSPHDGDGNPATSDRFVLLWNVSPDGIVSGDLGVQIADGFSNTADSVTLTIGPGLENWDDPDQGVAQGYTGLAFQTSQSGAVSAISIRKICNPDLDPVPPTPGGSAGAPGDAPDPTAGGPTAPGAPGAPAPGISGGYLTPGNRRGAPTEVEVLVDGHWLSLECRWDTPTWSHTWPGGSANASWTASGIPSRLTRVGLLTGVRFAGEPIWSGVLNEADDAEGQMNARGLFSLGLDFAAIDSDGNATTIPDVAVDAAIVRGLRWLRRASLSDEEQDVDISSGPVKVSELLDAYATDAGVRWGVDPYGYVYSAPDPTTPTWHLLGSLDELLTPSDDGIATALIGRYRTSGGFASTPPVIAEAEQWLGYSEDTVDLTARGVINETKAIAKLRNILKLARAVPTWANPLVLGRGDLMTAGQVPAALETARAGQLLRVHSQLDPRQGGQGYSDVLAGDTEVADGQLTWTPLRAPARSIPDIVAELMNRTRGDSRG